MKINSITLITYLALGMLFSIKSLAQKAIKCKEKCCQEKAQTKVSKKNVPMPLAVTYYSEFPDKTYERWHSYPILNDEDDWYGYNPYVFTDLNPKYYIVDVVKYEQPYKIIYSKEGKKIASHKIIYFTLPKPISLAISKSAYSNWKLSEEKEEITKDGDSTLVYKVSVERNKEKHILFYQIDGVLLKDKEIKL